MICLLILDGLSIEADELDQVFTIHGTGFPEGTVAEDSITLTLKNFMTGATIDNYETRHDEVDVDDAEDRGYARRRSHNRRG